MVPGTVSNVKIEPVIAVWGLEEIQKITTVADAAGSLNNKYIDLEFAAYNGLSVVQYRVWFNINAAGAAPASGGRTLVAVAGATGVSAAALATAIATALAALPEVASATASGADVTVKGLNVGAVSKAVNGAVSPAFTYAETQVGFGGDLGLCDGDISVSHSEDAVDITAHQEGTNVLDQIRTGKKVTVDLTLKETSLAQLKMLYTKAGGGKFTPNAGTEVFGWGGSQDFTSKLGTACKLVLHPVANASGDLSGDMAFWLAQPDLSALTFSGENPKMVPVTFQVYPDRSKKSGLRLFVIGDHTQDLSAAAAGT